MQEEKRRKFKEALHKIYFPVPPPRPPSLPPPPSLPQVDPSLLVEEDGLEKETDEEEASSGETGTTHKLTRSQRKRLRKRKLKEAAAAAPAALSGDRRKIIGPMLPSAESIPCPENLEATERDFNNIGQVDLAGVAKKNMVSSGSKVRS